MPERQQIRGYLACDNHADREVDSVCGECGKPVCGDCSDLVTDLTLDHYERASLWRSAGWLVAIIGGLLIVGTMRPFWLTIVDLVGKPLYIQGGLQRGLILFGLGLFGTLWIGNQNSGGRWVFVRKRNDRTVCEDCYASKQDQRTIVLGFSGVAGLVTAYGLYISFTNLFFQPLWIVGLGAALWVLRYELATVTYAATR